MKDEKFLEQESNLSNSCSYYIFQKAHLSQVLSSFKKPIAINKDNNRKPKILNINDSMDMQYKKLYTTQIQILDRTTPTTLTAMMLNAAHYLAPYSNFNKLQ